MPPPKAGYGIACVMLRDVFILSHKIVRSQLDVFCESFKTIGLDADALSGLAVLKGSCKIALQQEYTVDLDSLATLELIVKQLPYFLHSTGADNVYKLTQNEMKPRFGELTEFVSSIAGIPRSRSGHLME